MTTWVLQSNFIDTNRLSLFPETLREQGIPFVDVSVIPFTHDFVTPIDHITDPKLIPYGSTSLIKTAMLRGWSGTYFDEATFRADVWNQHRTDMLNQDAVCMTIKEAAEVFATKPEDDVYFIRPIMDLKQFSGTVTDCKEIARWMSSVESGNFVFGEDTIVAISPPKEIQMEWRHFVVNRRVVTSASYRFKGMLLTRREEDPAVIAEAQALADKWLPHETCVMDIALTPNGMKVIEFNCLNGSGIYYHDVRALVKAVTEYEDQRGSDDYMIDVQAAAGGLTQVPLE
jgi:hypothetical protein